jgi:predicted enzyme related to lactoylglutathione lyase
MVGGRPCRPPTIVLTAVDNRSGLKKRVPAMPDYRDLTVPIGPRRPGEIMTSSTTQGIRTVLHPVTDLEKAKAVYTAMLGISPQTDSEYYVGYDTEGQHIGLVPGGGPQGMTSPVAYWHVTDIKAKLTELTEAGATVKDEPRDVGGGRLVATVTDTDGNVLGVIEDR